MNSGESQKFIYRFGYCAPVQLSANERNGWEDESSGAFIVYADTEEDALRWGHQVANAFVSWLFETAGLLCSSAWEESEFAEWIESDPLSNFTDVELLELPVVFIDQMPDFNQW